MNRYFIAVQKSCVIGILIGFLIPMSTAQTPCPENTVRFVANQSEVVDTLTGLVWQRCSAGQSWTGTSCTGVAGAYNHEQALAYAQDVSGNLGWRLPNIKELGSLLVSCKIPPIHSVFISDSLDGRYWSSTPQVDRNGDGGTAMYINFGSSFSSGEVSSQDRYFYRFRVRLVRSSLL